jgi:hypothetical protein
MQMNEPPKNEAQDRFEEHLRSFRPVAPRALAIPSRGLQRAALAMAAAAILVIGAFLVTRHRRLRSNFPLAHTISTPAPRPMVAAPITFGRLNAAMRGSNRENDQDLTQMLDEASPRMLPRGHRGTALFELGKE